MMKHSARYSKIWLKKLDEIPLRDDADSVWAEMSGLLDQQLPVAGTRGGGKGGQSMGGNLLRVLSYILPAAMIVATATYFLKTGDKFPDRVKISKVKKMQDGTFDTLETAVPVSVADTAKDGGWKNDVDLETVSPAVAGISGEHRIYRVSDFLPEVVQDAEAESDTLDSISFPGIPLPSLPSRDSVLLQTRTLKDALSGFTGSRSSSLAAELLVDRLGTEGVPDKAGKITSIRPRKPQKIKKIKVTDSSRLSYGIGGTVRLTNGDISYGFGVYANYRLNEKLRVGLGARMNTPRSFSGNYTHKNLLRPDSLPGFEFTDSRKLSILDVPLNLTYQLSPAIGLEAGPVFSFAVKHFGTQLSSASINLDSTSRKAEILSELEQTKVNKLNLGFGFGLRFQRGRFDIHTRYEFLKPYSFSNSLGTNRRSYQGVQLGIAYWFK